MPLITGLIRENITLTVFEERTTQDAAGGSVPDFSNVLATGIAALFASPTGGREGDFRSDNERSRATFVSSSAYVGRSDVRFQITATDDPALSDLVDTYWRVESGVGFPKGSLGIVPARYQASVSRFIVPS